MNISEQMARRGMRLRTWAKAKGLSRSDLFILDQLSYGLIKGVWGRSKELREMLEAEGFKIPCNDSAKDKSMVAVG